MIVLEVYERETIELQNEIKELTENGATLIRSKTFQGTAETIRLLIELTPVVLTAVTAIVVTNIKAKRHISIKYKGVEVTGISEENALKIFENLMNENDCISPELEPSDECNEQKESAKE